MCVHVCVCVCARARARTRARTCTRMIGRIHGGGGWGVGGLGGRGGGEWLRCNFIVRSAIATSKSAAKELCLGITT